MSAAVAELTAEVSKSGNCLREVYLGDAKHVSHQAQLAAAHTPHVGILVLVGCLWASCTLGVALTATLVDSNSHQAKNSKTEGTRGAHRRARDLPARLEAGGFRGNAGDVRERMLRRTTRQPQQRTNSKMSSWCSKGRGGGGCRIEKMSGLQSWGRLR